MCGILGILPIVDHKLFTNALHLIKHRGPDDTGFWQDEEKIMLGHQRLSILDHSSRASQPMHYKDRFHIVYNGEIYNFIEIRSKLKKLGLTFTNDSDTEVILAAYAAWGSECVHKFNGMWAIAIWDSLENSLFLSRDPMGEKPLFYFLDEERIGFASEQKALLPFLRKVQESDNFHKMCSNAYGYESTEQSLFQGIKRFPAGYNGWYQSKKLRKKRYWDPMDNSSSISKNYEDQIGELRELLIDSCKLRLRADVSVGTGLSGGIDSGTIAACVNQARNKIEGQRLSKSWQNAFVASFPNTVMDETKDAKKIARHLGINLIEVYTNPSELTQNIEHNAYMIEEIHEVNPLPHINLYKKMRDYGVTVSLDGHGGDELFCGYESSILHCLTTAFPNIKKINTILNTYNNIHPNNQQFTSMNYYRILPHLIMAKIRQRSNVLDDPIIFYAMKNSDSLGKHLIDLSYKSILPTLLRNYDRYSMINGVEVRSPFLDPRIVKFAAKLPWDSKVRNGFSKAILRDVALPLLPKSIVQNKTKLGFAPPISDWIKGPMKEYILDEISSSLFLNSSLISPKVLSKDLKSLIFTSSNKNLYRTERIWKKFGIYLWEKAFLKNKVWKN